MDNERTTLRYWHMEFNQLRSATHERIKTQAEADCRAALQEDSRTHLGRMAAPPVVQQNGQR